MRTKKVHSCSFGTAICAGILLLASSSAFAQNMFVGNFTSIVQIAPVDSPTTFATGLNYVYALAFDGGGNLFEADEYSGSIFEFAPDGTQSTFASGLNNPVALAFNQSGNLFVATADNN